MATDIVLTAQIIDAAIAQIAAHLPANWSPAPVPEPTYTEANPDPHYAWETPLTDIAFGDYSDLAVTEGGIMSVLPIIIIRPLILQDADDSGMGGTGIFEHNLRLVHIRGFAQCHADSGALERNGTRARLRYARLLHNALHADANNLMGNASLTTLTGEHAHITGVRKGRWDFGAEKATPDVAEIRDLQQPLWAIAHDFTVYVQVIP